MISEVIEHEESEMVYKSYKKRFVVMATVVLLNISNAALWITYSPVTSSVANFYGVSNTKVNWFSSVYLVVTVPFTFISTFFIDKRGLKAGIHLGASLNCFGSIIKALGTSGIFSQGSEGPQYAISLTGQVFCAMGQSFLLFVPTKVSQMWFPEKQRAISTTILAMSNPLGIVIAQAATPFIVTEASDVPINNYIWMALAIAGQISTLLFITSSGPPTPASRSAERGEQDRPPYIEQVKNTFGSLPYMLLLFTLGGGIGLFNGFATLTQQLLCPLGYSDKLAALAVVMIMLMGFVGAAVCGILCDRTKKFTEITKISFGCATLAAILMLEFYQFPDFAAPLVVFSGIFGFFGVGAYPVGLELAVETTYPVEETISTAFIFLSGQIHGVLMIVLIPIIATQQPLSQQDLNICNVDVDPEMNDYTVPLLITMAYFSIVVSVMIFVFDTRYKRQEAEIQYQSRAKVKEKNEEESITTATSSIDF